MKNKPEEIFKIIEKKILKLSEIKTFEITTRFGIEFCGCQSRFRKKYFSHHEARTPKILENLCEKQCKSREIYL